MSYFETRRKQKIEDQFAFMGGKLIKEYSKQHMDTTGKSARIIVFAPFENQEQCEDGNDKCQSWSLFLKEIDRAFETSEEKWTDILHPSY